MSIDREDSDERKTHLDWMMDEFRKAQAQRAAKAKDRAAKSQTASDKTVGPASTTSE